MRGETEKGKKDVRRMERFNQIFQFLAMMMEEKKRIRGSEDGSAIVKAMHRQSKSYNLNIDFRKFPSI